MPVRIARSLEELTPLESQWDSLAARFESPLLKYDWFASCAKASVPPGKLHVVLLFEGEELAGIAPLMHSDKNVVPTLRIIGNPYCELFEPSGLIYRDETALRTLVDQLMALRMPLWIEKVREGAPDTALLAEAFERGLRLPLGRSRCLYVPSNGDWMGFEASLGRSKRDRLRTGRKRADKEGTVQFEHATPNPEEVAEYLEKFMAVEASGWKTRSGTAVAQNEVQQRFIREFGRRTAERGMLRVFSMWIGQKLAAMKLTVEHSDRLWEIKTGYDESFRRCSPGILLSHEVIRYVFESGLKAHEFLGVEEDWEHIWTDEARAYLWLSHYPLTVTGLAAFGETAMRLALARGRKALSGRWQNARRSGAPGATAAANSPTPAASV